MLGSRVSCQNYGAVPGTLKKSGGYLTRTQSGAIISTTYNTVQGSGFCASAEL